MERVDVYRGASVTDADGNTVQGDLHRVMSLQALVAPADMTRVDDEQSHGVSRRFTLYFRGAEPTGVLDTDRLVVRGTPMIPAGPVREWSARDGRHVGDVLDVGIREGG